MKVYAYATGKKTSTGREVYVVLDSFNARQAGVECNFELAQIGDLGAGDDSTMTILEDNKDFLVVNDDGLIDIDRAARAAALGI